MMKITLEMNILILKKTKESELPELQNNVMLNIFLILFRYSDELVGKMCGMYMNNGNDELSSEDEDFVYSKNDDDLHHGIAYSRSVY